MEVVKENVLVRQPLSLRWLVGASLGCFVAVLLLMEAGERLPTPLTRSAPPTSFIAEIAHEHLVNLTSIGPRVAGSYENEVLAVSTLVSALRNIAANAAPHHLLEVDVHTAGGAFSLTFLDGMNNVYRDVQSVVARLTARGGRPPPAARRTALLLNCHFDTVPDSPGASDDGAGCAVALETLRALCAHPTPHAHDVILLLNGAEENIMQASHAFITTHKWAPSVRAFINIEACGAGGREVLFQAGPHDPWIMEVYAATVPHPFASSLAQEIFESGVIPADTDFRVFRDFGNLSGVDLAWSANGYVYHTSLDTADRAPPESLQRTGDNVLALARGILQSGKLALGVERHSTQPVFFDVLGAGVVLLGGHAAAVVAAVAVAVAALRVHLHALHARQLYMKKSEWWRLVFQTLWRGVLGAMCGVAYAALSGALLHFPLHARLTFYSRPWLLGPLYAIPGVAVSWLVTLRLTPRVGPAPRGYVRARLAGDALCVFWAILLVLCATRALRSGFIAAIWTLGLSSAGILSFVTVCSGGLSLVWWTLAALLPTLQTGYVAVDSLTMLVPIMGRAGPVPHDIAMGVLSCVLALAACCWLLPLVSVTRHARRLAAALLLLQTVTVAAVLLAGGPHSTETKPQRLMVFHTRRTDHSTGAVENFFWMPDLDSNAPHSLDPYVASFREAVPTSVSECSRWVYCGSPYYLPALGFIPHGHRVPVHEPPHTRLRAELRRDATELRVSVAGPAHVVVIVSPVPGVSISRYTAAGSGGGRPQPARRWGDRQTYFFALHDARKPGPWELSFEIEIEDGVRPPTDHWFDLSIAGHTQFGPDKEAPALTQLLQSLPPHVKPAATGWGVDLHLYTV